MKNVGEFFLKRLRDNGDELSIIYFHLFRMMDMEKLNEELEYLAALSEGKDDYFKEHGAEEWFAIWHKSVRQTDYFSDIVKKGKIYLLTDEEKKEFKFLRHKVAEKGYVKASADGKHLFNDEYRRYLDLWTKSRAEVTEDSVTGHIDSILWNAVHMDDKNKLFNTFKRTFREMKAEVEEEA